MKLLIFLVGLAVAHATIQITPTVKDTTVPHTYQDISKSFIYKYEAFVNTTMPQTGVEFIGQKVICDVELNVLTAEIIHMNLTNIQVFEVNGTFNSTLKEKGFMYPVNISIWNSTLTKNYTEELKNPITFQYINGKIVKVFANKTDPEWVVNMKKGIINMLTLQLDNEDVFTKKEEGISGTCETWYYVKESRTEDNVRIFNITKTRDLTNCTDAPFMMMKTDDLKTKDCNECDKELTQPIKAMATFKYNVTGDRSNVFIESCISAARYVLSPTVDVDDGSFVVIQNQSLVLKEVKSKKIKPLPELTQRGNIRFIFPEMVNDEDKWNTTLKKVEFFVNILSNQSFSDFTLDTPSHFIHLVRSLRECNITQLRQVWNWTEKTMYKRDWIVKALPYVNKTDMTKLVKEMFFNGTINITRHGEELLLGLGSVQKPTIKMIQDIKDTCTCDLLTEPTIDVTRENVTKTLRTRRACWVTYGEMIFRFKKDERFVPSTVVRSLTDCEKSWKNPNLDTAKITKDTYKMLVELRDTDVKLHCIEAMGNAGLPDHTEFLRETIIDDTIAIDHRIAAVTALRRIAKDIPRKVMTILLPVLKKPTEDPELRIVCWRITLECNPTPAMMTLITQDINKWTNPEVRTFVLTHLKNLAKSKNPWEKELAKAARYANLFVRPFNVTFKQSQNRRMEFFTDDKKIGATCELDTVFSKQNVIPRRINSKCDIALYGQYANLWQLNIHTDSLNDVLDRVFGTSGSWYKRKSIFDMLSEKRFTQPTDHTKNELAKLKLKVDPYTKVTQRHASTQVKMFDTEMWFAKLDDKFFEELMDVGTLSTKMIDIEMELMKPQTFNFTKVTMSEVNQQMPTIVGLPLSYNLTNSAVIRVQTNTTFTATPSLQDVKHTDLVAKVNVTPEIMWVNMQSFGCHTPLNKLISEANNTIKFTLPLSTKVIVNYQTKKYSIEFEHMKKDRVDVLTFKHNVSLIHEKTMCGKGQIFKKNITVINGTQTGTPVNTTMCYQAYEDCALVCLNYTSIKKTDTTGPTWNDLRAASKLEIFAKKGTFNPDKVIFEYKPKNLEDWERVKKMEAKVRFTVEKPEERPEFVERSLTTKLTLTLTKASDRTLITGTMTRTDNPTWKADITGEQNPEGDVELDCEWGKESRRAILVNKTQIQTKREYFIKFVSDRWILPSTTVHNMTIIWDQVPQWLTTVGSTYLKYMPKTTYWMVKTLTPWEVTLEPKKNWIDNSYQMCMKSKTKDSVDLILVMQDQELTIRDIGVTNTTFLKKPLPAIIGSLIKPNITIIPPPTVCNITSQGLFSTFDRTRFNYTMPGSCPHVVARDCSADERFTVLLQNVTLREEHNTVKTGLKSIVYVSKTKFEIVTKLDTDLTTKKLEVKVNGQKVLENWQYVPKPEVEIEDTNTTIKRNASHVTLLTGQGLTVIMSCDELLVNVTHRHWNTTCGMCGNNDGEMTSELRTPWSSYVADTKFGLSWLVQGDDCLDQECKLKKFVSLPINMIMDEEIMIGNKKAACFSTEPVLYCPKECTPILRSEVYPGSTYQPEKMVVEVGFSCHRTTDPDMQYTKMKDMVYVDKTVDIIKDIEVPHKCNCPDTCLSSKTKW